MTRVTFLAIATLSFTLAAAGTGWGQDQRVQLAEARVALSENHPLEAVTLLEDALPGARADTRAELLILLRQAYPQAISQAEAAGNAREAASLREHLEIIQPDGPASPSAFETIDAPPVPPETPASPQAAATAAEPPRPPASLTAETQEPAASESLAAPAGPPPSFAPPTAEAQPQSPGVKQQRARIEPAAATAAPSAPAGPPDIHAADAAFRDKRYIEAGRIYGELARMNQLPEIRRDPWAYCRMVAVVSTINDGPTSAQDWKGIQNEILAIRQLSPRNWYAEYLRSLVAELAAKGGGGQPTGDRVVVRGSSPDENARIAPVSARSDGLREARRQAPAANDPAAKVGQVGTPVNNWKVWETPNFRIFHDNEELASKVAQVAEATRQSQQRLWARQEVDARWEPRCDIYLYPDGSVFQQATGQAADSPGFSTMGLNQGRVIARRVNLRADHPNLIKAILPHEVTHVVMADLFPDMQVPRWADEGLAVLAEPVSEQQLRAADLAAPLSESQLFALDELMTMDYPDGRYWALYYAQSVSLTRFLVELGTPAQFIEFVKASQRNGFEAELSRVYRIKGYDELQSRWFQYAQNNVNATVTARLAAETAEATSERR